MGERNKTRYWGGVGRKDSDKSGAGRSSTERIAQEETNKAQSQKTTHFEVKPIGSTAFIPLL